MRRTRPLQACLVILFLLSAGTVSAACAQGDASTAPGAAAHATMAPQGDARTEAWAVRPAYTHVSTRTEEAYHFALNHPEVLEWMPCYCGCGGMGHGSNLDCYFEPQGNGSLVFEEHASYCEICVDITLRAKQFAGRGASLATMRAAIDAEFGPGGDGTDTPYPV